MPDLTPVLDSVKQQSRHVTRVRADAIEDMILEVLARPECYSINRLVIVTHQEDYLGAFSPNGERIEIHRKAAGRHPRKLLAGIRFRVVAKLLDANA